MHRIGNSSSVHPTESRRRWSPSQQLGATETQPSMTLEGARQQPRHQSEGARRDRDYISANASDAATKSMVMHTDTALPVSVNHSVLCCIL